MFWSHQRLITPPADGLEEGLGSEIEREDVETVPGRENKQAHHPHDVSSRT